MYKPPEVYDVFGFLFGKRLVAKKKVACAICGDVGRVIYGDEAVLYVEM